MKMGEFNKFMYRLSYLIAGISIIVAFFTRIEYAILSLCLMIYAEIGLKD